MFWKVWCFSFFSTNTKNRFSKNLKKSQNQKNRKSENFVNFRDFPKNIFCFGRKVSKKIKIFKNKFQFSFCLYYVLAVSNFQVRGPTGNRSAVSHQKKCPFFVLIMIILACSISSFVIRLYSWNHTTKISNSPYKWILIIKL